MIVPKIPASSAEAIRVAQQIMTGEPSADATSMTECGVSEFAARGLVRSSGQGRVAGSMWAPKAKVGPDYDRLAAFIDSLPAELQADVMVAIAQDAFKGAI